MKSFRVLKVILPLCLMFLVGSLFVGCGGDFSKGKLIEPQYQLVFTDNSWVDNKGMVKQICRINEDGTAYTELTDTASDNINPVFSPDGKKLAFLSSREGSNYQLYLMDMDGKNPVQLTNSLNRKCGQPVWSSDQKQVAYIERISNNLNVFIMDISSKNSVFQNNTWIESNIDNPTKNFLNLFNLNWAPGGNLLFLTSEAGLTHRDVACVNNNNVMEIITNYSSEFDKFAFPSWSLDESKILCQAETDNKDQFICTIDIIDKYKMSKINKLVKLNDSKVYSYPSWSPDNQRIAYIDGSSETTNNIYIKNISDELDAKINPITKTQGDYRYVKWSPDGRKLAFYRNGNIYIINSDGSNEIKVTKSGGGEGSLWFSWCPVTNYIK